MKNTSRIWRLILAVAMVATIAACSDGELSLGAGPSISPPPPIILKFEANPPQVELGGSTVLSWEVEDADTVEISTSADGTFQFHAGPLSELKGSTTVDSITDTTDFTITAYKTVLVAQSPEAEENTPPPEENAEENEEGEEGNVEEEEEQIPRPAIGMIVSKSGQIPVPAPIPEPSTTPQTVTASSTITVSVVASVKVTADITADKATINTGESTVISWTVSPSDADVTVTASNGEEVVAAADCTDVSGELDYYPANGCAQVSPLNTTTYTLNAVDSSGTQADDRVTINVTSADVSAEIFVNGVKNAVVGDFSEPVSVTWSVSPENALATVTASPEAVGCDLDGITSPSGSANCTISDNTTFSIHAELGDAHDDDNANVVLQVAGAINLNIKADPWAFVSEEIEIEVTPADTATASTIQSIKIGDAAAVTDPTEIADGIKKRVRVPNLQGVPIEIVRVGATAPETQKPQQAIVPLNGHQFFRGGDVSNPPLQVTRVISDPSDLNRFYYGTERPEGEFGEVSIYRLKNFAESKEFLINVDSLIKSAFDLESLWSNNRFFAEVVRTYPVGAIAVREEKPEWIFAGTTGLIMYSNDSGESWNRLDAIFRLREDGYEGNHATCAGRTQTGRTSGTNERGDVVSMHQVCDIIAKADGRLIVAFDRGIAVTENVEAYIEKPSNAPWIGVPHGPDTGGNYVYNTVAHDLEEAGSKIFAATNQGIYVNETGDAQNWMAFNNGSIENGTTVYCLAYDAKSEKLFAGTDDGVYVSSKDGATWERTEGSLEGPVLSLAVDPAYNQDLTGPVVIAGTANGMAVTRDGGKYWSVLNSDVATDLGEVRSVAVAAIVSGSDKVTYKISATGDGYAAGIVEVSAEIDSSGSEEEEIPEEGEEGGEEIPEITDEEGEEEGEVTDFEHVAYPPSAEATVVIGPSS